ncbi:MAG: glycosyl hydrolase [Victivallaceae bacterium]
MSKAANRFILTDFELPPAENTPGYFWKLNSRLEPDMLKEQLREMAAMGARSVCMFPVPKGCRPGTMPSEMEPDYLSPEYMDIIEELVAECKRLDMNYYLYDEGGWPSGGACGQVWQSNPEKFARCYVTSDGKGGVKIERQQDNPAIAAPYPNVITPGVTDKFIELTHEAYRKKLKKYFGKTIRWTFTDEPAMPYCPAGKLTWTADFGEEFYKRKGYELEPLLPKLLPEPEAGKDAETTAARIDFQDVRSQLFIERYMLPLRAWCRRNNLLSGGHLGGEDEPPMCGIHGYGHILRALRALDLPGVDVIWRQLFPGLRAHPFPKYASSVAHQSGRPFVLGEVFAVYGNGLTPLIMRWLLDYLLVRGINVFVFSNYAQTTAGNSMAGCRPHFGPVEPLWKYFDPIHNYAGRCSYLLTQGERLCSTAVYFDIRSLWAGGEHAKEANAWHERVSEKLLRQQCDFDYIDDDVLETAEIVKNGLKIGQARYSALIIPERSMMTAAAREKLKKFRKTGGTVFKESDIAELCPTVEIKSDNSSAVRVCKRVWQDHALYFIVNESDTPADVEIVIPEKLPLCRCDALTGKLYAISGTGSFQWRSNGFDSLLLLTGESGEAAPEFSPVNSITLDSGWTLKAEKRYFVGEEDYRIETCETAAVPVDLGDWRKYLGDEFSGDAVYRLDFNCPYSFDAAWLELGEVRYACSVILNGIKLGKAVWRPFRFDVSGALRPGSNRLEVTVTNTLANAIAPKRIEDFWTKKYPPRSPYEDRQRQFESESLLGGLFGPVKLAGWNGE